MIYKLLNLIFFLVEIFGFEEVIVVVFFLVYFIIVLKLFMIILFYIKMEWFLNIFMKKMELWNM